VFAATALSALTPRAALATWPFDPNVNVPLCTAAGNQAGPAITSDGAGGAIATWGDARSGNDDVYVQRLNAAGVPQWTADGVALCTAAGNQNGPAITSDGAGGAIVCWQDGRNGANSDIYAQRVNAAGVPQWTADGVALCVAAAAQAAPRIASDGAGGAIVTWFDFRSGPFPDIYARRVNTTGVPQWTADGVALCIADDEQASPTIVSDAAGGAIVTWSDSRSHASRDIYAQRVDAAGAPQWTADGLALCTAAGDQVNPTIISDDAGGAIVTWADHRSGTNDIYGRRVNAAGVPQWTANGVALCTAANNQLSPAIASDLAGGAIVAWHDLRTGTNNDVYAQRASAAGVPLWTANGVALCTAIGNQLFPAIASDGAGGAIVAWQDLRGAAADIYARQVNSAGVPLWTADGVPLCTAANSQDTPTIASDGAGGAIVTWSDFRNGTNSDIHAQNLVRYGRLGRPEASITNVSDFKADQGGKLRIAWSRSYLDTIPTLEVGAYGIWRQVSGSLASQMLSRGARMVASEVTAADARPGNLRLTTTGAQSTYWEGVGSILARGDPSYTFVASTFMDSTATSNPLTTFMIDTHAAFRPGIWDSAPDSGYSADNTPPITPAPFTGAYSAGATHLHWGRNAEPDLAGYALYRGGSAGFTPGPGNLISAQPDTGYDDVGASGSYYKLAAVDIHDNSSAFALLTPAGTLWAPGPTMPRAVWFAPPVPNPVHDGSLFRFGLPVESRVSLALYDQQGRRVRELANGAMPPGEHTIAWNGQDAQGHVVPSGLYFCRLSVEGRNLNRRFAVTR